MPSIATKFQYINSLFYFPSHYMFRTLWAILRWDIQLDIFKDYYYFNILYMGPVFTENFNDFTIFIFVLSLITCIEDHWSKYRYRHITSLRQVVYVQRIRCIKNSPSKYLIVYLTWRWPVGAETCSEWERNKGGVDILKLCCDWRRHKEPVGYIVNNFPYAD
jgi:hypothetical protein